eukprot:1147694-Pelagomonas_calceolata.AAC.4
MAPKQVSLSPAGVRVPRAGLSHTLSQQTCAGDHVWIGEEIQFPRQSSWTCQKKPQGRSGEPSTPSFHKKTLWDSPLKVDRSHLMGPVLDKNAEEGEHDCNPSGDCMVQYHAVTAWHCTVLKLFGLASAFTYLNALAKFYRRGRHLLRAWAMSILSCPNTIAKGKSDASQSLQIL